MKTCSKCGVTKEDKEFRRRDGNICKPCERAYDKEHRKILASMYDPDEIKICTECGFTGKASEFVKCRKVCKQCSSKRNKEYYNLNSEHIKESTRNYQKNNVDKYNEAKRAWYKRNIEKRRAIYKKWLEKNADAEKERLRKHHLANADAIRLRTREWKKRNPERRKEQLRKQRCARRGLGHNPLNKHFKGSDEHHLRYSNSQEDKDNDMTIYVPKELHRSIYHNGNTGQGMREINILLLEWYFANTPEENRNKKAVDLYLKYCMLPDPVWTSEQNAPKCT